MTNFLAKIVAWIVAGYPEGVPGSDRVPLLALLRRRLTDDEVKAVVSELVMSRLWPPSKRAVTMSLAGGDGEGGGVGSGESQAAPAATITSASVAS